MTEDFLGQEKMPRVSSAAHEHGCEESGTWCVTGARLWALTARAGSAVLLYLEQPSLSDRLCSARLMTCQTLSHPLLHYFLEVGIVITISLTRELRLEGV